MQTVEIVLPPELEQAIQSFTAPLLQQGRPNWDLPHSHAVAHFAGAIAHAEGLDTTILKTAGYLHDIGYFGLYDTTYSHYVPKSDKKEMHMIRGAKMAEEFLSTTDLYHLLTDAKRSRIVHLVRVHDQLESLQDLDEVILMEADTLGMIDTSRVTPTFDKESAKRWIDVSLKTGRLPRFRTDLGRQLAEELVPKFEQHFGIEQATREDSLCSQ